MSKKTWKNMTLRSGKLAWRLAVFALTVGAILAAKALKLLLVGASAAGDGHEALNAEVSSIDTSYILDPTVADVALDQGKIGAAEYAYFVDPYQDGLGP